MGNTGKKRFAICVDTPEKIKKYQLCYDHQRCPSGKLVNPKESDVGSANAWDAGTDAVSKKKRDDYVLDAVKKT